jgi:NDP-sugar pyrophosphorylase family protein
MKVVIVAGGLGTRMRSLSKGIPKPMIKIFGKPILEHLIVWLKASGFNKISLCLGHKAEAVSRYFGNGETWRVNLEYYIETEPRGTAGCVLDACRGLNEDILVVYGDLFVSMNLKAFLDFHAQKPNSAASLVLFASDHPQDSDLVKLEKNQIKGFYRDLSAKAPHHLACAAVWALRKPVLDMIPSDRPSDFGRDIFPQALKRGLILSGYVTNETLADLGTPERFSAFEKGRAQ